MNNGLYNGLDNGLHNGLYNGTDNGLHNGLFGNETAISREIIKDGLVLYLDVNNPASYSPSTTKWNDLSGFGTKGTLVNGVGYSNNALVLDGVNDYINLGSSKYISQSTSFTFSCWFKKQIGTREGYQTLFSPSPGNFKINIVHSSSGILMYSYNDNYRYISQTSPISIFDNKWHFLTFTVKYSDITTWNVYVDGTTQQNILSTTGTAGLAPTTTTSYISGETSEAQYMDASLGMVLLYSRILTFSDIEKNYKATKNNYLER